MRGEPLFACEAPSEEDVDVRVARGPRIFEQQAADRVERDRDLIAQPIERVAQRPARALVPAGMTAAIAAAVLAPARHAVRAAPARILEQLDFPRRRHARAKLGVVGEARALPAAL